MRPASRILPIVLLAHAAAAVALAQIPVINSISPSSAVAGGPAFTLTLNGTGFFQCDGTCLGIDWLPASGQGAFIYGTGNGNGTSMTVLIPANLIATPGTASISVEAFGGTSTAVTFTITSPNITSISPSSAVAGSPAFTLTLNGAGFFPCLASVCLGIDWQPASGPFMFLPGTATSDGTQMTVLVPANLIATPGIATISVQAAGGKSNGIGFTVSPPSITSIAPISAVAGGQTFTLTVNGLGFYNFGCLAACQPFGIYWLSPSGQLNQLGGSVNAAATQLTVNVPSALIAAPGIAYVSVVAAGGTTNSVPFTITSPRPTITSISPSSVTGGGPEFTLTVNGSGFLQCPATVAPCLGLIWQPSSGPSALIPGTANANGTQFTVPIVAGLIATAGTVNISVQAAGGVSSAVPFTITAPVSPLTITSITPATVPAGSAAFSLSVTGTGFVSGAAVVWNQTTLASTFLSATQLSAAVPATLVAKAGAASVVVVNPGGTASNQLPFTVTNPPPSITGLSPSTAVAGSAGFTITVNGANFVSGAAVAWNAVTIGGTFVSATQLTAVVPASLIANAGTAALSVVNPDQQVSNAATFTIQTAPPAISSLGPSATVAAGSAFTLTVNGSGFVSGAVVDWNGAALPTTFVSAAQLTASVTAALIANPGSASISVTNPGGAASAPVSLTITLPPAPQITFAGPGTIAPATSQTITFSIAAGYPLPLRGQIALSFQPNAVNSVGTDPAIQFAGGGTVLGFNLDANSTNVPSIVFQTGSTAGTITATLELATTTAGSQQLVITAQSPMQILTAAPVISKVTMTQTSAGLEVDVTGFATSREVTQAVFNFTAAPGFNLSTSSFTVAATPLFTTWYQGPDSQAWGSQFTYSQIFAEQGGAQGIASVSVTLSNAVGASSAVSSN